MRLDGLAGIERLGAARAPRQIGKAPFQLFGQTDGKHSRLRSGTNIQV
jgi:hypothetical protein